MFFSYTRRIRWPHLSDFPERSRDCRQRRSAITLRHYSLRCVLRFRTHQRAFINVITGSGNA